MEGLPLCHPQTSLCRHQPTKNPKSVAILHCHALQASLVCYLGLSQTAGFSLYACTPFWFALSAAWVKNACTVLAQWLPHRLHLGWVSIGGTEGQGNLFSVGSCSVNAFCEVLFSPTLQNHYSFSLYHLHVFTCSFSNTYFLLSQSLTHLPSSFFPAVSLVLGIIVAIFGVISILFIVNKVVKLVHKNGIASVFYSCGEYSSMRSGTNWDRHHSLWLCMHTHVRGEKVGSHYSALLQGQRNMRTWQLSSLVQFLQLCVHRYGH